MSNSAGGGNVLVVTNGGEIEDATPAPWDPGCAAFGTSRLPDALPTPVSLSFSYRSSKGKSHLTLGSFAMAYVGQAMREVTVL